MNEIYKGAAILLISVTAASIAQILLKKSAEREHPTWLAEYLNPFVIAGYGLLFASTVLTLLALKTLPLSWSPAVESVSYPLVAVLGYFFLGEKISRRQTAGFALILAGTMLQRKKIQELISKMRKKV